jgi:hypothetical protein
VWSVWDGPLFATGAVCMCDLFKPLEAKSGHQAEQKKARGDGQMETWRGKLEKYEVKRMISEEFRGFGLYAEL